MSILVTVATTVVIYLAVQAGISAIIWAEAAVRRYFKRRRRPDLFCDVAFTEADLALQADCRAMLQQRLPNGLDTLRALDAKGRQQLITEMVDDCNRLYQLEVESLSFRPGEEIGTATCGFYDPEANAVTINLDLLCTDTDMALVNVLETVFHEMRHALQRKAVTTEGYAFGSIQQQHDWAVNLVDYISAAEDYILYRTQTVEADATAFSKNIVNVLNLEQQ